MKMIWVVSIKYVLFILRADNEGEGGIMALTALARRAASPYPRLRSVLVILGLIGAALFYGDSMITPAISVLSGAGSSRRGHGDERRHPGGTRGCQHGRPRQ